MPHLSIRVLGPFQVSVDGVPVDGFATDKVRALLAYLALSPGHPHRREALAGLLWPDFPERSARASLRNALANLRNVLGEHANSGAHNSPPLSYTAPARRSSSMARATIGSMPRYSKSWPPRFPRPVRGWNKQ
jgi:hypothetical protein